LLALLSVDAVPCVWFRSNGALRAAMIVNPALRLGKSAEEIRAILRPHLKSTRRDLIKASHPDPASYVERIIADCSSAAPRSGQVR
jgi:hypothetical protein